MDNLPEKKTEKPLMKMAQTGGLIPNNFEGLWRMATIMSQSGMMPRGVSRPESVFVAVQMGLEIGLAPMQAVQNIAVINGRPSIWGDSVLGLVRASGKLKSFSETFKGSFPNDDFTAVAVAERDNEHIEREFSISDAKAAGLWKKEGPWRQYPKRMLQMRARSWVLRDGFGDVLKGLRTTEEVMDYDVDLRQSDNGTYETASGNDAGDLEQALADRKPTETAGPDFSKSDPPSESELWDRLKKHLADNEDRTVADILTESLKKPAGSIAAAAIELDVADKKKSEPADNTAPVEKVGTEDMGDITPQPDPDWDPRTERIMGRYYPPKALKVKAVAEDMGIPTENRMPKDVHKDILAASQEPPEDKPTGQLSTNERFFQALAQQGVEDSELPKVNDYVQYCIKTSGGSARDVYLRALEDIKSFIEYLRGYQPGDPAEQEEQPEPSERRKLVDFVKDLKKKHSGKWDRARVAAGIISQNIDAMGKDQLQDLIAKFNEQESADNDGDKGGRDPFAGGF